MNRHRALGYYLSMISAQTRSAFVARENRCTVFRIMLYSHFFSLNSQYGTIAAASIMTSAIG